MAKQTTAATVPTASAEDLNEFNQMMEEELESIYSERTGNEEKPKPISVRDQVRIAKFAEEFSDELQGEDKEKWMFCLDVAMYGGETPKQLRELTNEKGIEPVYQVRMAIHLMSKELGVTYQEAAKVVRNHM